MCYLFWWSRSTKIEGARAIPGSIYLMDLDIKLDFELPKLDVKTQDLGEVVENHLGREL